MENKKLYALMDKDSKNIVNFGTASELNAWLEKLYKPEYHKTFKRISLVNEARVLVKKARGEEA